MNKNPNTQKFIHFIFFIFCFFFFSNEKIEFTFIVCIIHIYINAYKRKCLFIIISFYWDVTSLAFKIKHYLLFKYYIKQIVYALQVIRKKEEEKKRQLKRVVYCLNIFSFQIVFVFIIPKICLNKSINLNRLFRYHCSTSLLDDVYCFTYTHCTWLK